MDIFFDYITSAIPGLILGAIIICLLPKKEFGLRIVLYLSLFVFVRDLMTPHGIWTLSVSEGIRFIDNPLLLGLLGVVTLGLSFLVCLNEPILSKKLAFFKGKPLLGVFVGVFFGLVIGAPAVFLENSVRTDSSFLVGLFLLCLLGNFLEELLFRGFLQGHLGPGLGATKAAIVSGIAFSMFHSNLAFVVTDIGLLILVFTLYEGLICAFLQIRFGLVPATLAHGLGIFFLASGLI